MSAGMSAWPDGLVEHAEVLESVVQLAYVAGFDDGYAAACRRLDMVLVEAIGKDTTALDVVRSLLRDLDRQAARRVSEQRPRVDHPGGPATWEVAA